MANESTNLMLIGDSGLPSPSITVGVWPSTVDPAATPNAPKLATVTVPLPTPYPANATAIAAYAPAVLAAVHTAVDGVLAQLDADAAQAVQDAVLNAAAGGFLGVVIPHTKGQSAT